MHCGYMADSQQTRCYQQFVKTTQLLLTVFLVKWTFCPRFCGIGNNMSNF